MRTSINSLLEIPKGNYTGYYWLSDAEKPEPVNGAFTARQQTLPFIVEGNLYDADNDRSISIRHNGEKHIIHQYDLSNLSGFEKHPVALITHRLPGKGKVKFWELWKEEEDRLCAGMKTLRPYARVFVGFE